jgi:phospholipid transport system substrate-binding protein
MNPVSDANLEWRNARSVFASAAIIFAVVVLAAGFAASPAVAGDAANTGPVGAVRETIAEATPVFKNAALTPQERRQRLRAIAIRHFDFVYMARSAMGTHWKTLTDAQRREFVPTFTDYVMDTYLGTLKQNTVESAGHGLKDKARIDGPGLATVFGEVRMPNLADPLNVEYSLRRDGGTWKLYDIVVDGSSTMATYRREFNQKMNAGGFDQLEAELKRKIALAPS